MSDPERWLDDAEAPAELRAVLERAERARPLNPATRARVSARVGRLAALPLTAAAWLSVKSAAALGVAGGITAAGVLAVAERYQASHPAPLVTAHVGGSSSRGGPPARKAESPGANTAEATPPAAELETPSLPAASASPSAPRAVPSLNPVTDLPRGARAPASLPAAPEGLAAESQLLEQARRALASAPLAALALVNDHAARFPSGQLAAERRLIEMEALDRAGRRAEARALAERLLAGRADDLYAGRVRRLLEKMNGASPTP